MAIRISLFAIVLAVCLCLVIELIDAQTPPKETDTKEPGDFGRKRRAAIRHPRYRWTNKTIPIEVTIRTDLNQAASALSNIVDSVAEYQEFTCLNFPMRSNSDKNYVQFRLLDTDGPCDSWVGMIGGEQVIKLGKRCIHKATILHEIGHAIGLHHEQVRPDREGYVDILQENIKDAKENEPNFKKESKTDFTSYGLPYDYKSIMHYEKNGFAKPGTLTIKTDDPDYQDIIGTAQGLSFLDIKVVNLMYNCSEHCDPLSDESQFCPSHGFIGKDCKCYCEDNSAESPLRPCTFGELLLDAILYDFLGKVHAPCYDLKPDCHLEFSWSCKSDYMKINCRSSCNLCEDPIQEDPI